MATYYHRNCILISWSRDPKNIYCKLTQVGDKPPIKRGFTPTYFLNWQLQGYQTIINFMLIIYESRVESIA